jgi:hypothetical protein
MHFDQNVIFHNVQVKNSQEVLEPILNDVLIVITIVF